MDGMPLFNYVLGLSLRFGLPIAITLLIAHGLRRLDQRWQQQAEANRPGPVSALKCWVLNDCPADQRANCPAYQQRNVPCWQVFRDEVGRLPQRCLGCEIFRRAPVLEAI